MLRHRTRELSLFLCVVKVLIKPKPVFQAAVVSEQTRQLVTETLQQVTRSADVGQGQTSGQDGSAKDEPSSLAGEASHGSAQGTPPTSALFRHENDSVLFEKLLKT